MAKDPVCEMIIDEEEAQAKGLTAERDGKTYYFCSKTCKHDFEQDPSSFIMPQAEGEDLFDEGTDEGYSTT